MLGHLPWLTETIGFFKMFIAHTHYFPSAYFCWYWFMVRTIHVAAARDGVGAVFPPELEGISTLSHPPLGTRWRTRTTSSMSFTTSADEWLQTTLHCLHSSDEAAIATPPEFHMLVFCVGGRAAVTVSFPGKTATIEENLLSLCIEQINTSIPPLGDEKPTDGDSSSERKR